MRTIIFLSLIILASANIEKYSSYIIRNGSMWFAFQRSVPRFGWLVTYRDFSINYYSSAMNYRQPEWANWTVDNMYDSTPDINVISDDTVRLYYCAFHAELERTVIGVATHDIIRWWFEPTEFPLVIGAVGENLSHPSLVQLDDGSLMLYYLNTTDAGPAYGRMQRVKLTNDGLSVAGEPE